MYLFMKVQPKKLKRMDEKFVITVVNQETGSSAVVRAIKTKDKDWLACETISEEIETKEVNLSLLTQLISNEIGEI